MHVVTFYSYKGGVGRTMALVNCAAILAQRGKKVLIIDFDLEAPGIPTYKPFSQSRASKGVVEYVGQYVVTRTAPNAADYLVECKLQNSSVWVMPAGTRDREYSAKLNSIDWQTLYAFQNGFLFFEDLRQQWERLKFDYVLIDSRTGHTDVGGICTRQLPDAVVLMFFPNDQNVIGLESVVRDIRDEPKGSRQKSLHFCVSDVPDLDDEDHILERKLNEAKEILAYVDRPFLIHHYSSLNFVEQSVFVVDRPQSRLASEYDGLVDLIVSKNLEDRAGALAMLASLRDQLRGDRLASLDIPETLANIKNCHPKDGEVAWGLAHIYSLIGEMRAERESLTVAIDNNYRAKTARRRRATIELLLGRGEEARADLTWIIKSEPDQTSVDFIAATDLLRQIDENWLAVVSSASQLQALSPEDALRFSRLLMTERRANPLVIELMASTIQKVPQETTIFHSAKLRLVLALISSGKFQAAREQIGLEREQLLIRGSIEDVFNFAMAEWGVTGRPDSELMARVLSLASTSNHAGVNMQQCLSLASHICGDYDRAFERLAIARDLASRIGNTEFSCWSYLEVDSASMVRDLDEMELYLSGVRDDSQPTVFAVQQIPLFLQ